MRKILTAVAAMAAVSMFGSLSQAAAPESKSYLGVLGDVTNVCSPAAGLPGIGGNCFSVAGNNSVSVGVVNDIGGGAAGFRVGFYGPGGLIGQIQPACDSATFEVPSTASTMRVFVTTATAMSDCDGQAALSLAGTITVFRDV